MSNNPNAKLKAVHLWRTCIVDGKEVAVAMEFTTIAWKHLGHIRYQGKLYPKQGFKLIAGVETPPEAKKPAGEQSAPASQGSAKVATQAKAAEKASGQINTDEVEALIKADEKEKLPMVMLLAYVKAKALEIPGADKMPQPELFELIKATLPA